MRRALMLLAVVTTAACFDTAEETPTASRDAGGGPPREGGAVPSDAAANAPSTPTVWPLAALGLPRAGAPSLVSIACDSVVAMDCEKKSGPLPAFLGGCRWGLYLEARSEGPIICNYHRAYVEDAGATVEASAFSWECYGPIELGRVVEFVGEYSTPQYSVSGVYTVRFDRSDGQLTYEASGCMDTSSGGTR